MAEERIVDNRVFLLGLDELCVRVKRHESTELLTYARAVAARLNVTPEDFWDTELWTTDSYRERRRARTRP